MGLFDYQPRYELLKWVINNGNKLWEQEKQSLSIDNCWLIFREKDGALWASGEQIPYLFLDKEKAELVAEEVGKERFARKCRIVFD